MIVLGIETTCDETAAAVVEGGRKILSSHVASQAALHAPFGGVVPEIACRAHVETLLPLVRRALDGAGVSLGDIDGIAVANTPGLVGAILVGLQAAKALAWAKGIPLVGVHHIEAHVHAVRMEHADLEPPFVALVASGGHTSLYEVDEAASLRRVGSTIDDAAGEAFDKVSTLLGLGYPGGPAIERAARGGDRSAVKFPRSFPGERSSLDFSFSGLKTAVLYRMRGQDGKRSAAAGPSPSVADVAASFQEAVVDVLVARTLEAAARARVSAVAVGGGVACNGRLRERLAEEASRRSIRVAFPSPALCTDNAAMIAGLGGEKLARGLVSTLDLEAVPT